MNFLEKPLGLKATLLFDRRYPRRQYPELNRKLHHTHDIYNREASMVRQAAAKGLTSLITPPVRIRLIAEKASWVPMLNNSFSMQSLYAYEGTNTAKHFLRMIGNKPFLRTHNPKYSTYSIPVPIPSNA